LSGGFETPTKPSAVVAEPVNVPGMKAWLLAVGVLVTGILLVLVTHRRKA